MAENILAARLDGHGQIAFPALVINQQFRSIDRCERVPTLTQRPIELELLLHKRVALQVIAWTEQSRVVPLSTALALYAADLAVEHKLAFADAQTYIADGGWV